MNHISLIASRYWPLANTRQAKRQAIRLIRAKRYLDQRGIAACALHSSFKYQSTPTVLA